MPLNRRVLDRWPRPENLDAMALVPLRTSKDTTGEVSRLLRRLEERGTDLNVMRAMANCEGAFRNFLRLGNSLLQHSKLDGRWRELAIMRVAWRNGSDYEWGQHVSIARRAGLSDLEIDGVKEWPSSEVFDETARAVLQYTDDVDSLAPVERSASALQRFLGPEELAELTLSVGFWSMVARFLVALQIEREPGTPGFDDWRQSSQ